VQFHPTALHLEGAPSFLLSEALRGEGAHLLNAAGERFMQRYHPLAELAPRDVVARAIVDEMRRERSRHVFLDLSGRGGDFVKQRFPRIHATCLAYGIDLDRQPAPVHPAAHYAMGGVWTDLHGRTSLQGLWAAGEVACTGVHGANRLASNSLLEGVVFGARAGTSMRESELSSVSESGFLQEIEVPSTDVSAIRSMAGEWCGIVRSGEGLREAIRRIGETEFRKVSQPARAQVECSNTLTVVELIARCALAREESRGAHYRIDYPEKLQAYQRHSMINRSQPGVRFE